MKYHYGLLVLLSSLLFIPQQVSAQPSTGLVFVPFIYAFIYGVIPFLVAYFIGKYIKREIRPSTRKTIIVGIVTAIILLSVFITSILLFVMIVSISPTIIGLIFGFVSGNHKWNSGKIVIGFFLFVIFSIFSLSLISMAFMVHNSLIVSSYSNVGVSTGFTEIGKEYNSVNWPVEVDGKLAYEATEEVLVKNTMEWNSYIVFDGQIVGEGHEPKNVNGYLAYTNNGQIIYNNEVIAEGVHTPFGVNGKVGYHKWGPNFIFDGVEVGKEYDTVPDPTEKNNHRVSNPTSVNNQLAYQVQIYDENEIFIVFNGEEIGKEFDCVGAPVDINGELSYLAGNNCDIISNIQCQCEESFIVFRDQRLGLEYDRVYGPYEINGKLAYGAQLSEHQFIIYDGTEVGKQYVSATDPFSVRGKLGYIASDGFDTFIYFDGKEIGREYYRIRSPIEVGGKLAYVAEIPDKSVYDTKSFIVMEN